MGSLSIYCEAHSDHFAGSQTDPRRQEDYSTGLFGTIHAILAFKLYGSDNQVE